MGIERLHMYPGETRRKRTVSARLWLAVAVVGAVGVAVSPTVVHAGAESDTGLRHQRWHAWRTDEGACPGADSTTAPHRLQVQTMLCLVNDARARRGLRPLTPSRILKASAAAKAADIARCHDFRHEACGKRASQAARALGYAGPWGENIYIGKGRLASPRAAVDSWLNSPGHRTTIFRPYLRTTGIARLAHASVTSGGQRVTDGVVWVHQVGA